MLRGEKKTQRKETTAGQEESAAHNADCGAAEPGQGTGPRGAHALHLQRGPPLPAKM